MTVIPERAVSWVDRWTAHGLSLGRHDGNGNLLLAYDLDDGVAADLVAEIKADAIMRHGVGVIVVEMVKRAAAEGGLE